MILVVLGFIIAALFNVDTIAITKILAKDKKVRDQMVEMAINKKEEYGQIIDSIKIKTTKDTTIYRRDSVISRVDTSTTDTSIVHRTDSAVVSTVNTVYQLGDKYFDSTYKSLVADAKLTQSILGLSKTIPDSIETMYENQVKSFDRAIEAADDDNMIDSLKTRKSALKKEYRDKYLIHPYQKKSWLKVLGWLLTAWAISLGAPFWFDLLNRFIQLRSSGSRVPTSNDIKAAGAPGARGKTGDGKTIRG